MLRSLDCNFVITPHEGCPNPRAPPDAPSFPSFWRMLLSFTASHIPRFCAPKKVERKRENGNIAWRRSPLSRAWAGEFVPTPGSTVGGLKSLGRLGRGREQICSVCSAALEAFGAARTLSAPIQHAKSEKVGCWPSEPLDSLIGGVLANQLGVWEGRNTMCALFFYALRSIISCFNVVPPAYCISCKRVGSTLKRCVECNFSVERVRQEATEWSDKGSWLLVWVWAVCGGLKGKTSGDTTRKCSKG